MIAPEAENASLTVTLFGPMRVQVDGRPLPSLRSRKALWLLALLILRAGRPPERGWLAGTLWPDIDQRRAAANLRVVLSELRRALGSQGNRLRSSGHHTISLDLTGADVDVIAFDAAAKTQEPAVLSRAIALYCGPLLEGCNEEWAPQERAVREQSCLRMLQSLGNTALAKEDWGVAADHYRRAVGIDPWWEMAQRGLMQAFAGGGNGNAAMDVYQDFVRLLRQDDPRAAPDEQTTALYTRLRTEAHLRAATPRPAITAGAAAPAAIGYLPQPLTDLIGRESERAEVAERLRRSRLVTLTGTGGIGKTRLALAVAGEAAPEFAGGTCFVALEALSEGEQVIPQIAGVLKVQEENGRTLLEGVTSFLRDKNLLLVLDNCEHVLKATAQAAGHLLRECAGLRILATSREALRITGEAVWAVPGLGVPAPKLLPADRATLLRELPGYAGVRLFVERAQAAQNVFALTEENAHAVSLVCARLEGIPLALELAATRVRAATVTQIAARLDDHLSLLTGGDRGGLHRQQTLRATLDWSYALLSGPEQRLLECASVFSGGWTLDAAVAICSEGSSAGGQMLDLLTSLVDKSLVVFEETKSPAGGRYRLLEVVRQYAAERLAGSGRERSVRERHRDWFLKESEEADLSKVQSVDRVRALRHLEREHENLRAALTWCEQDTQRGAQPGLRLASALWPFWSERSHYSEGRTYLQRALAREDAQGATAARAQGLKGAAVLADRQGDYVAARALHEQSLAIFRQLDDRWGTGSALGSLSYLAQRLGDVAAAFAFGVEAQAHYEQNLIIFEGLNDMPSVARTHHFLGVLSATRGDYALAAGHHERSLQAYREAGDKNGVALALVNLCFATGMQGDYAAARALQTESLGIYRELGDKDGIALALVNLGDLAYRQGDYALAATYHRQSLNMCREAGNRKGMVSAYHYLVLAVRDQGDYAAARVLEAEHLLLCQELGDRGGLADGLEGMATILLAQGHTLRAVRLWGAVRSLRESSRIPLLRADEVNYDLLVAQAKALLSAESFQIAWDEGHSLTWEQAVADALAGIGLDKEGG